MAVPTVKISDMAQSWNNAAVAFTALKMNVTNIASLNGSLLFDFQYNSAPILSLFPNGQTRVGVTTTASAPAFGFRPSNANGIFFTGDGMMGFSSTSQERARIGATGIQTHLNYNFMASAGGAQYTALLSAAANTIEMRNPSALTTGQSFRINNQYVDQTNYERLSLFWQASVANLQVENSGTGNLRNLRIGASSLILAANGSDRWTINSSGHLLANTDNTYSIGVSGANRPSAVYVAAAIVIGTSSAASRLCIGPNIASNSQINLASGIAPTTPTNGDIWFDGTDLKMRVGGTTKTFTLT